MAAREEFTRLSGQGASSGRKTKHANRLLLLSITSYAIHVKFEAVASETTGVGQLMNLLTRADNNAYDRARHNLFGFCFGVLQLARCNRALYLCTLVAQQQARVYWQESTTIMRRPQPTVM